MLFFKPGNIVKDVITLMQLSMQFVVENVSEENTMILLYYILVKLY